ncbi:hypothetical protein [Flavobacterium sp.]|uniref:hypothetical protein n=1 Tax=Flavobacterium sp. TaxID=239 RepID=UPI0035AEF07F
MKKIAPLFALILLLSCSTNTSIVNSWRDPETTISQNKFEKVLVVALVKDETTRRITENRIASGNKIFKVSYPYLNDKNLNLTKEQKIQILKNENFDGVVTMRLVSTEKETQYVPGTNTSLFYGGFGAAYGYGYGFGNWYGMYSPNFYNTGYYKESTIYLVETNIFSLKQNKLIWTGTTKSSYVTDIGETISEIIRTVVKEIQKDGSIEK